MDAKDELREKWEKEQLQVASQVVVIPDDDECGSVRTNGTVDSNSEDCRFVAYPVAAFTNDDSSKHYFGGVDVSFPDKYDNSKDDAQAVAVYVVFDAQSQRLVYQDWEYFDLTVPYIPSFLAFREMDPLLRLIAKQRTENPRFTPSALLVDGNGIWHAHRAGLACFLGVRTGLPTIGVGKTFYNIDSMTKEMVHSSLTRSAQAAAEFVKSSASEQDSGGILWDKKGIDETTSCETSCERTTFLMDLVKYQALAVPLCDQNGQTLACAMIGHGGRQPMSVPDGRCRPKHHHHPKAAKPRNGVGSKNPIYVSVGHNISLRRATSLVAALSYSRIPEPIRQADLLGRQLLMQQLQEKE